MSTRPARRKHHRLSDEEFVTFWQSAQSLAEIAEKDGGDRLSVASRASRLRKLGVPLKLMLRGRPPAAPKDVRSLTALAKKRKGPQ